MEIPGLGTTWWRPGARILTLWDGRNINYSNGANTPPIPFVMNNASIYTAGIDAPAVADFDMPTGVQFNPGSGRQEAYYFNSHFTHRGGDLNVNVGGSIRGADNPHAMYDWAWWRGGHTPGGSLGSAGYGNPAQPFSPGYFGALNQTSTSVVFDAFRQSLGALGGGDVSVSAGGDATNLGIALPSSLRVSGGRTAGSTKTINVHGGGDLELDVGGAINNSWFYVAKGRGDVRADGAIGLGAGMVSFVIDDAKLNVQAGGTVRVASIQSASMAQRGASYRGQSSFHSYTQNSTATLLSLGGDVVLRGVGGGNAQGPNAVNNFTVLPSVTRMIAPNGSIGFGEPSLAIGQVVLDQYPGAHLDVLARKDIRFTGSLLLGFDQPYMVGRVLNPFAPNCCTTTEFMPGGGAGYSRDGSANVHAGRDEFSAFYALEGDLLGGTFTLGHESRFRAGDDIRLGAMNFFNQDYDDVSMVQAAGSIYLPNIAAYGVGRMWVQAGDEIFMGTTPGAGIRAIEFADTDPLTTPLNGVDLTVLAGIDQQPEYASFIDYYLGNASLGSKPEYLSQYYTFDARNLATPHNTTLADGSTEVTIYAIDLINYWREMNGRAAIDLEGADGRPLPRGAFISKIAKADYDAALAWFEGLDPVKQAPLATRIMFAELKTGGREAVGSSVATDPVFERNGNPTRGYDAIGRLFPGAQRKPGEAKQEGEARWFGDLIMTNSQIRTDGGGDAEILVPGGMVQLASLGITNTSPSNSGVLTQDRGSVYALTYDDYIVNQSRTMTADDGDILIWSSFGDIDAGKGRKTSLSIPPVQFPIDDWAITRVVRSGLPNGAGIATLNRVDGTPGGDVDLYAFNGIVNAGDAGVRASRDLFIGAIEIRGLDNITVGGVTNVDLGTETGDVGALNLENFARSAEDDAIDKAFDFADQVEKMRTVRQTILTGSVVSFGIEGDEDEDEEEKKTKKR